MKLDKYGNNPRTSRFESKLALIILERANKDVLQKVNQALLSYIFKTPEILRLVNAYEPTRDSLFALCIMSEEEYNSGMTTAEKLTQLFNLETTPDTIIQIINAQKIFIEDILDPYFSDEMVRPSPPGIAKSLRQFAQDAIHKKIVEQAQNFDQGESPIEIALSNIIRPDSQFLPERRGRGAPIAPSIEQYSIHFGSMSPEDVYKLPWAANWFKYPFIGAKEMYERDYSSYISREFQRINLPYISGPSGTATYCIKAINELNVELSTAELKDYMMLIAGAVTGAGHHSLMEVALVAANLNLYPMVDSTTGELKPRTFFLEDSGNAYQYFLSDGVRSSQEYNELMVEYPEYFTDIQQICDYLSSCENTTKQQIADQLHATSAAYASDTQALEDTISNLPEFNTIVKTP